MGAVEYPLRDGSTIAVARAAEVAFGVGSADRVLVVGDALGADVALGAGVLVTFAIVVTRGSGGSVETGGSNALVGVALGVGIGVVAVGAAVGVFTSVRGVARVVAGFGDGVMGEISVAAGPGGDGVPAALTTVDAPAGRMTAVPPALVSTLPAVATTVVSPSGKTATNELDPARMTDAIAALCTSYRPPEATVLVTAYQTRPRVCCIRTT